MLAPGTPFSIVGGGSGRVVDLIGEGGQGWVHDAEVDGAGERFALKWYKRHCAVPDQYQDLDYLIDRGSPHPRFLWPLGLAHIEGRPEFGYLMRLRNPDYLGLTSLLSGFDDRGRPVDVPFRTLFTIGFELAQSFLALHAGGLCYRDVSFSNVFFDAEDGHVLICDTDNVGIDDGRSRVLGTPRFIAPEIVRMEAVPSTHTDLHSLAVLLFYLLLVCHPLEGAKTVDGLADWEWEHQHFGVDPLFVFDPANPSNRPVEDVPKRYWENYPSFVRDLFTRAFTVGLQEPVHGRVQEGIWADAMLRLRDSIQPCPSCRQTNFWDERAGDRVCFVCGATMPAPLLLEVRHQNIVLSPTAELWSSHFDYDFDRSRLMADMSAHPTEPNRWGLRNRGERPWTVTVPDRTRYQVDPGQVVEATDQTHILFGPTEGRIRQADR